MSKTNHIIINCRHLHNGSSKTSTVYSSIKLKPLLSYINHIEKDNRESTLKIFPHKDRKEVQVSFIINGHVNTFRLSHEDDPEKALEYLKNKINELETITDHY